MKKNEPVEKHERVQAGQLERAFDVMHALVNSLQPLKLTALSEVARLDPSGTLRLLKTLIDLGYVARDDERKSYLPSAKALFPLGLFHPLQELRRDAADLLFTVQRDTTATSALQVFLGGQRIVLEQRAGSNRLTPFVEPTVKSALHASASGKLLLSTMSPEERAVALGPAPYDRFTPNTLVTREEVEAELVRGTERGFFEVNQEAMVGMSAIAAPIHLPNGGVLGCMVAFGTSVQLPSEAMVEKGQLVRRAADMLSAMSPAVRALEPLFVRNGKSSSSVAGGSAKADEPEDSNGKSSSAAVGKGARQRQS